MFDKIMFEKIFNLTCSFDELKHFNFKIDEKEFDVDNCFEKYYSLETILKCIQLHKDKRISGKYLAYWSNAYNWIIMGGFKGKRLQRTIILSLVPSSASCAKSERKDC